MDEVVGTNSIARYFAYHNFMIGFLQSCISLHALLLYLTGIIVYSPELK
jgi:hypothetical protein